MCLRKLQNWSRPVIHSEFSRFVPSGPAAGENPCILLTLEYSIRLDSWRTSLSRFLFVALRPIIVPVEAESQFLDGFQGDAATVHIPEKTPSWLWNGMRCSNHPSIVLVRDEVVDLVGGTGTIRERQSAEEAEDDRDGGGLGGRGRTVLEARAGGDTGRHEVRGQGMSHGSWKSSLPIDGIGAGKTLPPLPGMRNDENDEEEDDDEDELSRSGGLAHPKTNLGPVREAVQLEAIEQVSQTISALALEGLELTNPARNYL